LTAGADYYSAQAILVKEVNSRQECIDKNLNLLTNSYALPNQLSRIYYHRIYSKLLSEDPRESWLRRSNNKSHKA
jgi:hypothetical protein